MRWRPAQMIRPVAVALIHRGDEVLVMAVRDDTGAIKGWRPPGGAIEFGETAEDALRREFLEEFGQRLRFQRRVCILENLYDHEGAQGHEIVFVFEAQFEVASAYLNERHTFVDAGVENEVQWRKVHDFSQRAERLFPDRLLEHLQ